MYARARAGGRWAALGLLGALLSPAAGVHAHPPQSEARARLRAHLHEHPTDMAARLQHSTLLRRAGRQDEALRELDRALSLHPDDHALLLARAQLLLTRGDRLAAATTLEGIPAAGQDSAYHLMAARLSRHAGHAAATEQHYRASLALAASVSVALELGAWLEARDQAGSAARLYAEQLRANGGAALLRLALVDALRATGRPGEALRHVDALLAAAQLPTQYRLTKAELLDELGEHVAAAEQRKLALKEAEAAYRRRPSALRLSLRGRARCAAGRRDLGMVDLREARTRAPGSPMVARWLAQAEQAGGGAR